jgi:hypothetical protein
MVRHIVHADFSYLRGEAKRHLDITLFSVLFAVIFLAIQPFGFIISGGLLLIGFSQLERWHSYRKGISGEKRVSRELRKLDDSFFLLDDILLYPHSGNIDHIVLGHNGIFVIETKNYSGDVRCFGDTWYHAANPNVRGIKIQSISQQVKKNAGMLNRFLRNNMTGNFVNRLFVKPIIVFTNSSMTLAEKNPTVLSTKPRKIRKLILKTDTGLYFSQWELEKMANAIKERCRIDPV